MYKAFFTIAAIPVKNGVQGIKEGLVAYRVVDLFFEVLSIIKEVECLYSKSVQHPGREIEREGDLFFLWQLQGGGLLFCIQIGEAGMLAQDKDAAPKPFSFFQTVDPGHRIGVVLVFVEKHQHFFEVGCLYLFLTYIGGLYLFQLESDAGDDPCEAHASAGGFEKVGFLLGTAGDQPAICHQHIHLPDMMGKTTVHMVVLAMYVTGDGASHRDKFCAGSYGKEPSLRDDHLQNTVQRKAALAFEDALPGIEGKYLVEFGGADGPGCQ